jgi:hypothetical protein
MMTQNLTPKAETTAASTEDVAETDFASLCQCGQQEAIYSCTRCQAALCDTCSYHEENGTSYYCRDCANEIVGVCDVCNAIHAQPCHDCRKMVCEQHQKRVIERWGWGGAPGQGGFTSWFPIVRTYCQEHGKHRFDIPKPELKALKGYDGSSPEW